MKNIRKGDKVLNTKTNTEYVVDSIETCGNNIVVFTEGDECSCFPISEIIKIPQSWLSNFLFKKINKYYVSDIEEKKFDECLSKLKLVTIEPFTTAEFEKWVRDAK